MIVPDGSDKEETSASVDYSGMIKFATAIVIGLLTIVGFGWDDLTGSKSNTSASNKKTAEVKKDADEYEDLYLDEEIEEDEISKKEFLENG
mgnify:CR=1 FL=1